MNLRTFIGQNVPRDLSHVIYIELKAYSGWFNFRSADEIVT